MKTCPQCKQRYDDTWKICLTCNRQLEDPEGSLSTDGFQDIRDEISAVRYGLIELNERLNNIEHNILTRNEKLPAKDQTPPQKETMKASEPVQVKQILDKNPVYIKVFKYRWKINDKEMVGEYRCKDESELRSHMKDIGGELIEILEKKDARAEIRVRQEDKTRAFKFSTQPASKGFETKWQKREEQPKKSISENFEQILGEKWFNKLGILAVVIGVALLVGYSFKYLGPTGKIGIGFTFGIGMLLFGHFIEKREGFSVYGKGLVGGGWAISYFTTFAMHHIPAVRLIESPFLGMVLLLGVSAFTILDIYRYKSQVATAFSYLLMFITLMITPVSLYTMAAAVPVAVSFIFFMYKRKWLEFGIYGMIMTYVTYMAWFGIAQKTHPTAMAEQEFFAAATFLILYWAIFVIATLLVKKDETKALHIPSIDLSVGFEGLIHIINTLAASFIGSALLNFGFLKYVQPALLIGCGLYLILTILTSMVKARSLCLISSSAAIIFAAIYLSVKYSGYHLTVSYILLAQLVLLIGIIFKESYWRIFSFAGLIIIICKLLIIDSFIVKNTALAGHLSTRTLLFAFAFLVYLANHVLYSGLKKAKQLIAVEENDPDIISYSYPLIYAMGTWLDLPKVLTAPCWIILGVILLQLGITKNNYHQRIQGYILGIGSFQRLLMSNMLIMGGISIFSYRMITCVPVLLLLYYCMVILQDKAAQNVINAPEKKMIFIFPYMIFIIIMLLIWYEVPKDMVAPIWGIIAVAYSLRGIYSKEKHYLSISSIAALSAGARAVFVNIFQGKYLVGAEGSVVFPIITIGALYLGNIFYLSSKEALKEIEGKGESKIRIFLHSSRLVYSVVATLLLTILLIVKLQGVLLTVSLCIEGMLLFLLGFGIKEKYWRIFGLAILLLTLCKAFLIDLRQLSTLYYILCLIGLGLALLFVSYIYTKHKDKIKKLI